MADDKNIVIVAVTESDVFRRIGGGPSGADDKLAGNFDRIVREASGQRGIFSSIDEVLMKSIVAALDDEADETEGAAPQEASIAVGRAMILRQVRADYFGPALLGGNASWFTVNALYRGGMFRPIYAYKIQPSGDLVNFIYKAQDPFARFGPGDMAPPEAARVLKHDTEDGVDVVMRFKSRRQADQAARLMEVFERVSGTVLRDIDERQMEALVTAILAREPRSGVEDAIRDDNAIARARYLDTTPTLTAAEIHANALSGASNRSALAARWKKARMVFAVSHGGLDRFPAFQFRDGQPDPAMRIVLNALPVEMTPWQVAFWFASANGWLDGRAPQEMFDPEGGAVARGDVAALVGAAERLTNLAVG